MKRRTFFKGIAAALTASFAPALPAAYGQTVVTGSLTAYFDAPRNENALLDAVFENMQNAPELSTGTLRISLHSGKLKINEWDADRVNAIIFGGDPGESARPSQRETKSLPARPE